MEKEWLCKNGHVLGAIQWNGNKVPYLALYRHAIDMKADRPEGVDVIGPLMGRMPVTCDVDDCGDVRFWDLSMDVLESFLVGLHPQQREQLAERLQRKHVKKRTRYKNRARVER